MNRELFTGITTGIVKKGKKPALQQEEGEGMNVEYNAGVSEKSL